MTGMSQSYGLILPFPDGSESFVNGFEAGGIYALLKAGEVPESCPIHTANVDLIRRMVAMHGCVATFEQTTFPEWTNVTFERKPYLQEVALP